MTNLVLWGNSGREGHRALKEISEELNPVSVMLILGLLYIFHMNLSSNRETWEECEPEYTEVFYKQDTILEQQSTVSIVRIKTRSWLFLWDNIGTMIFQIKVYAVLKATSWVIYERLKDRRNLQRQFFGHLKNCLGM